MQDVGALKPVHYEHSLKNSKATWKQSTAAVPWLCQIGNYENTRCNIQTVSPVYNGCIGPDYIIYIKCRRNNHWQ